MAEHDAMGLTATQRDILSALAADDRRSIYAAAGGLDWWVDWQGGGPFLRRDVDALRDRYLIAPRYPGTNAETYAYAITDDGRAFIQDALANAAPIAAVSGEQSDTRSPEAKDGAAPSQSPGADLPGGTADASTEATSGRGGGAVTAPATSANLGAAPSPEPGWRLVPVEATAAMLNAPLENKPGIELDDGRILTGKRYESRRDLRPLIWAKMLAAAPAAPSPDLAALTHAAERLRILSNGYSGRADDAGRLARDMEQISAYCREAAAELLSAQGQAGKPVATEDAPCFYCGAQTDSYAGDPGRWPLVFAQPDGTGIARRHHVRCVTERLSALTTARAALEAAEKVLRAVWRAADSNEVDAGAIADEAHDALAALSPALAAIKEASGG